VSFLARSEPRSTVEALDLPSSPRLSHVAALPRWRFIISGVGRPPRAPRPCRELPSGLQRVPLVVVTLAFPRAGYCAAGHRTRKEKLVATPERRGGGIAGISTGGVIVIVGIVVMLFWSFLLGLIITLVGLVAFGGFVRGKWY
jgi:hypothetical protein